MVLVFGVFYVLMIRPQQKRQRELQQTIGTLKAGDRIVTTGGVFSVYVWFNDGSGSFGDRPGTTA